ncbi:MAG: hypothetical protein LUD25_02560 [Coriobacteriaceae bacterium]|nr:hypothetical protein [Coriobacteriaceae bacterium]
MKVTQKRVNETTVKLQAVATPTEVNQALQQTYAEFSQQTGLRPEAGKTLAQLAEEKLGISDFDALATQQAIEWLVPFAIDDQGIVPAFAPKPQIKSPFEQGSEFIFELNVVLKPECELTSYDPVTITVQPFTVDEEVVDEQIEQIAENYASYAAVDPHPIAKGDTCELEMECSEDGERVNSLCTKSRTYAVGKGHMPESFDAGILGAEPGDTRTFTFQAPGVDIAGNEIERDIDCTVTIHELQEKTVPTIDDAWVAQNMPYYCDYESLRKSLAEQAGAESKQEYESHKLSLAAKALATRFDGRIDDVIYEEMRKGYIKDLQQQLQAEGTDFKEFVQQQGGEEQFGMMVMMQIREMLVQGYSLDAVYRHEGLEASDEDILEACYSMNPRMNPEQTRQQMEENGCGFALHEAAERACANKWVLEHAIVNIAE